MTNLTDKWKKRKLPKGDYYVLQISWCEAIDKLYYDGDMFFSGDAPIESKEIKEVLAPVPSYEEWFNQGDYVAFLEEENARLKELLKECRELFVLEKGFMVKCIREETLTEMITKIDEALR